MRRLQPIGSVDEPSRAVDSLHERTTINETPIITVIGKAFWDIGHAPKDQSNRRKRLPQYAVWEIHPIMALHVIQ
jgi:hypothetical protein